jgi:hypothetical protein
MEPTLRSLAWYSNHVHTTQQLRHRLRLSSKKKQTAVVQLTHSGIDNKVFLIGHKTVLISCKTFLESLPNWE